MNRKAISKRKRFEVFKLYNFTCVYCGSMPPNITLEVDHIIPVSKGGSDDISNLACSCFDCNRGKSNKDLKSIPNILIENSNEKLEQYKQYIKWVKEKTKLENELVDLICDVYESYNEGYIPNEKFQNTIKEFIKKIGFENVKYAMNIACSNSKTYFTYKYFCGVCWNIFKKNN
jgi:hypothetical protein